MNDICLLFNFQIDFKENLNGQQLQQSNNQRHKKLIISSPKLIKHSLCYQIKSMQRKLIVYFYQSQNKFYLRSDSMNKSLTKLGNQTGNTTDRSRAKSSDRQIHGLTYTREIIIKTQQPDIPQITILKVQRVGQNRVNTGLHNLQRILQQINLKKTFQGFSKMCQLTRSSKLRLVNANRLGTILKNRQKKMMSFCWLKLLNMKIKHRSKLNTGRLISRLSLLLVNKAKAKGFSKIKQCAFAKTRRSATQGPQIDLKQIEQNLELQKAKIKNLQFSQKFIVICKKLVKPNIKNFLQLSLTQLQPGVGAEIQRYQQLRNKKGQAFNNETVLVVLNNHIISIKGLKKDFDSNLALLKDLQKDNNKQKIKLYERIQKQFQVADNQIRDSFEKHKKIQQKQLARIVQGQLKQWTKQKDVPLYTSRLFISAIIVKLIKDGTIPFGQFLDILDNFLQMSNDNTKLSQFKKTLRNNDRSTTILITIVNRFMQFNTLGLQPIIQKGFSENEEIIMLQIKSIKQQIRDFITKFNNPGQRVKLKKTFSTKRPKAPEQLRDLYVALNQLMGLMQNLQPKKQKESPTKKQQPSSKNIQLIIKILKTFNDCLKQGNYKKWESFLNTINKEQNKSILDLLDAINDILNQKIQQQASKSNLELQKLKKSEVKMKQQNTGLKNKNNELQKKIKSLQSSRVKQTQSTKQLETQIQAIKQKDNLLAEWEKKYNELMNKFNKLQKQKARQKSISASKAQTDKQLSDLKQKLGIKDEEITNLKEELKKIETSSKQQKNKYDQQRKKMQAQIDKQIKLLQKITTQTQKLKQQQQNKSKNTSQNEAKVKKYQIQIKKYEKQVKQLKNSTIDSINPVQYNQIISLNETMQNKINDLTRKIENLVHQLETKQSQIKNMRNSLIKQQSVQSTLQKTRSEFEALGRKTQMLQNTIESLKHDLESKTKRIQQYERLRRSEDGARQPSKSFSKVEKNAQYSIGLIRQLNKQLQKLKKSEMTLQQINKQLQNVHHHGEDVQVLISKIQIQNSELRKLILDKDKNAFDLQAQVNKLTIEINIIKSQNSKLSLQLSDKQDHIKRLQLNVKDRQALINKDLQNKNDYIKKLQGIISISEQNVNQLNAQILKLKNKQPEIPAYVKNQTDALQKALNELKIKDQTVRNLQKRLYDNQQKYLNQKQKLEFDLRNSNKQSEIDNLIRQGKLKDDTIRNLQKKVYDNNQSYLLDKQKWQIQLRSVSSRQSEFDNLSRQLRSKDQILRNLQKKVYDNEQRYMLDRQKWESEIRNSAKQGQLQNVSRELKIKIELISNLQRTIGDNERRYLQDKQRLQDQLRNYSSRNGQVDNLQRELRSKSQIIANLQRKLRDGDRIWQSERQRLQQQLKSAITKYHQIQQSNRNLLSELQTLKITIQQQRIRMTTMTSSRAINVDNIVLLLANITSNYIRLHPKPDNAVNNKTAQQIFDDLTNIKNKYIDSQNDMFMYLEQYIVRFVQNDIAKYRYQLMLRIDQLNSLKDRLVQFLNNQINLSKNALNYQYQYQMTKQSRDRTADKSMYYQTPGKMSQISKITQQISQIREKTINASRLFDSRDLRR